MVNCFQFLVNIDQCLNMSDFDMFFYKLKSRHSFHLNNVRFYNDSDAMSIRNAMSDIRMYLDKYPFRVERYHVVFAVRSDYEEMPSWKNTILYKLLKLQDELQRAKIYANTRESIDKAISLIVFYDTSLVATTPEITEEYWGSCFAGEFACMWEHFGLTLKHDSEESMMRELGQMIKSLENATGVDALAINILKKYYNEQVNSVSIVREADSEIEFNSKQTDYTLMIQQLFQQSVCSIQVFRKQIDKVNRGDNIKALLRLVDFLNKEIGFNPNESLSIGVKRTWNEVWDDNDVIGRYSKMLKTYKKTLLWASDEIQRPYSSNHHGKISKWEAPEAIEEECALSDKNKNDLEKELDDYLNNNHSSKDLSTAWKVTYNSLKVKLNNLDLGLKNYADKLSRKYKIQLKKRKDEMKNVESEFVACSSSDLNDNIIEIQRERNKRLSELKDPKINATLTFQDQLRAENALEQTNTNITLYTRCMNAMTVGRFLLLIAIISGMFVTHHTFAQSYVYQSVTMFSFYFGYILTAIVFLFFTWIIPYRFFRKKIHKSIELVKEELRTYVDGYSAKQENFKRYIQLLNEIDDLTRRLRLLSQKDESLQNHIRKYTWHRGQIKKHLEKERFFDGLVEACTEEGQVRPINLDMELENDVINCHLYWPQGKEG